MRTTLDSMFKVGLGTELNTLSGSDESSIQFSNAFDEASSLVYYRYVDLFWQVKRYLNIGSEAKLKKSIQTIDEFVMKLIQQKRGQMKNEHDHVRPTKLYLHYSLLQSEYDITQFLMACEYQIHR
jgi:cytochrome P450